MPTPADVGALQAAATAPAATASRHPTSAEEDVFLPFVGR